MKNIAEDTLWGMSDARNEWCEGLITPYYISPYFAEFFNVISSFPMIIFGLISMRYSRTFESWIMNLMIAIIGSGSSLFHATRRQWAEYFDEVPMMVLTIIGMLTVKYAHSFLNKKGIYTTFVLMTTSISTFTYLFFNQYEIFANTIGILSPLAYVLSFKKKARRKVLYITIFFLQCLGMGSWQWEQWLVRNHQCPVSMLDFRYYLHAYWHLFATAALFMFNKYLEAITEDKTKLDQKTNKATKMFLKICPKFLRPKCEWLKLQGIIYKEDEII